MVKIFISILFLAGYTCYRLVYRCIRKTSPVNLVVLTYHSIRDDQRQNFVRQMDVLKRSHLVFADTEDHLNTGGRHVAITFDDGFHNFVENALPELIERSIPAMLFIPTGYLGKKPGWISNQKGVIVNESVMRPDQLQALPQDVVRIGSHSVTHRFLTLMDEAEVMQELIGSKLCLENLLNRTITSLSLPYGAYDNAVLDLAKIAGYMRIFSSWPVLPSSNSDGFLLGRVPVSPDETALEFRLKIMGGYQWLPMGISLKRTIYGVLRIHNAAGYPSE